MRRTEGLALAVLLSCAGCRSILGIDDTFLDDSGFADLRVESIQRVDPDYVIRYCNDGREDDALMRLEVVNDLDDTVGERNDLTVPPQGDCIEVEIPCTELGPDCRAEAQLDAVVDADDDVPESDELNNELSAFFGLSLRVFVTAQTFDAPELRSVFEADKLCQQAAQGAGIGGVWNAWLSDVVTSPRFRTRRNDIPLSRTDDVLVLSRSDDLFFGSPLLAPIDRDENAASVPAGECVWTDTDELGDPAGGLCGPAGHCGNWSLTADAAITGEVGRTDRMWTIANPTPCDQSCRLYCIEQPAQPSPAPVAELTVTQITRTTEYEIEMCNMGDSLGANRQTFLLVYDSESGRFRESQLPVPPSGGCVSSFVPCFDLNDPDCTRAMDIVAVADARDQVAESDELNNSNGISLAQTAARVFVSSNQRTGDAIGSAVAGDAQCQLLADSAGLGGQWRAWLSDSTTTPAARFVQHTIPYQLRDTTQIAANFTDLIDGLLDAPIDRTEFLGTVIGSDCVWTGTDTAGQSAIEDCEDWTNAAGAELGMAGFTDSTDAGWTGTDPQSCTANCRLFCFEQ